MAAASRRLVEKLVALDARNHPEGALAGAGLRGPGKRPVQSDPGTWQRTARHWDQVPSVAIDSLAEELLANRNLLSALAGPKIALTVDAEGGALPVALTSEDLTRVLVNLVKNAAEAMPTGGRIQLSLRERPPQAGARMGLLLSVEDSGPGIPLHALERIFEPGFSTHAAAFNDAGWAAAHRGLGLSITRSIIEAAGGRTQAANRPSGGARLEIDLPVRLS